MKTPVPMENQARFSGRLRHYHRAGGQKHRTWEEWVDGSPPSPAVSSKWPKFVLIAVGYLILGGIIVGLIVELL